MATLTNTKIKATYQSLLKTTNNTPVSGTNQYLTDGFGNTTPLSVGTDKIGIGTTTPQDLLSVGNCGTLNGNLVLSAAGGGVDEGASVLWNMSVDGGFANSHLAKIKPNSYATGVGKNTLDFYVGGWNNNADVGGSKMTITSEGNVGIGNAATSGYKLDVSINNNAYANVLRLLNTNAGFAALSGFTLETSGGYTTNFAIYKFNSDNRAVIENLANAPISFNVNGGERIRINPSGNVGIGTTSPRSKLDVNGGVQLSDDTATASATKVGTFRYRTSGNNSYVDMCMQTGASSYEWVNIVTNSW